MYSVQLALARGAQPENARDEEGCVPFLCPPPRLSVGCCLPSCLLPPPGPWTRSRSAMELALLSERNEMVEVLAQHGAERPQSDDA